MSKSLSALVPMGMRQWLYNLAGFNQYGLVRDDLLSELRPDVQEALRRLPEHIRDERNFRIIRAIQLDHQKRVLPKEQWTKLEDDKYYLMPYLKEIWKENEEKDRWNAQ